MPLGQGIVEILEAIPTRIEVSGSAPTWKITGPSFDAVLQYAQESHENPTVLSCHRRDLLWPRVTLTVTVDPKLARTAPPLQTLRAAGARRHRAEAPARTRPTSPPRADDPAPPDLVDDGRTPWSLEEIFTRQEQERARRRRIPGQRRGGS